MPTLDVVLVNWNSGGALRECLRSLAGAEREGFELARVVVVDNASTDGSAGDLEAPGLPLELVQNDRNRGFAAACNQGARGSGADHLLFLNPDTRVFPRTLAEMTGRLERDDADDIGIVGPQLVDGEGAVARSCARFPTLPRLLVASLGLDRLLPGVFRGLRMGDWDHAESRDVDQVIGAFFLVRSELWRRLGGFDERFFLYFEELDFARRAAAAGWRSRYLAEARAFHAGGGSSSGVRAQRLHQSLKSRILYAEKHLGGFRAFLVGAAAILLEAPIRCAAELVRRPLFGVRETLEAYRLLLLDLPELVHVRPGR